MESKYCDFSCEHASFPNEEMLGACRTMSGVYCALLCAVVPKHVPCRASQNGQDGPAPDCGACATSEDV